MRLGQEDRMSSEVDLASKSIHFDCEDHEAQRRERRENLIRKWQAAGEMWRVDLALEYLRQKASAMMADELACVQEATKMPASGLTNRQRRELYRDERRSMRELTSRVESSFPYPKKVS